MHDSIEAMPFASGPGREPAAATASQRSISSAGRAVCAARDARTRASCGSAVASGQESSSSQRASVVSRPSLTRLRWWSVTRSLALARSRPAIAWPTAASTSPCASYQAEAREWSSASASGLVRASSRRRTSLNSWWKRYRSPCLSRGTRNRFARSISASIAAEPCVSSTASHAAPDTSSSTDARSRNQRISSPTEARTSSEMYSSRCRESPAKSSTKAWGSCSCWRRIDARLRPAAHPSVRSVRRAMSSGARSTFALCRSDAASTCDSCRSAARTSLSSPCARHRPTGRFGSERLESTIWTSEGACSTSRRMDSSQTVLRTRCQSSTTRTDGGASDSSSTSSGRTTLSTAAGPARSASSDAVPARGCTACSPAIRWLQNLTGSLSPSSADSHTNGVRSRSASHHWASSVVLPYPAGAQTSVSFLPLPSRRRSRSCPRGAMPFRAWGGASFERSSGTRPPAVASLAASGACPRCLCSVLPSVIALSVRAALFHPG